GRRLSPSVLTVTSTADSGSGTLRDALAKANNGNAIVFALPNHLPSFWPRPIAIQFRKHDHRRPPLSRLCLSPCRLCASPRADPQRFLSRKALGDREGQGRRTLREAVPFLCGRVWACQLSKQITVK